MTSYRFCRPDDSELLISGITDCVSAHLPGKVQYTSSDFKRDIRELGLWASSCMVALERNASDVIAIVVGCKRGGENHIALVGARPGHLREGHISHMLNSLGKKLAILGPPDIYAEVPEDRSDLLALAEKAGYLVVGEYCDVEFSGGVAPFALDGVEALSFDNLVEMEALNSTELLAWERRRETLAARKGALSGFGIVSAERIESYLLFRQDFSLGRREIFSLGAAPGSEECLGRLLRWFVAHDTPQVVIPRLSANEVSLGLCEDAGGERRRRYLRVHAVAGRSSG